jgi:hypothetical protein
VADTDTTKRAAKSPAAKSAAAKSSTAKKRRAAATASPRKAAGGGSSRPRPETIGTTAGSKYLTAVLAHTGEQAEEWDAAGRALGEELRALQGKAAGQLPQDTYAQRLAVASPSDVAALLQVHQGYLDEINRVAETLNAGYEKAVAAYTKKVQSLWEDSRERAADDFAEYVDELREELTAAANDADPEALATLGAALIAMSQLAGAVRQR